MFKKNHSYSIMPNSLSIKWKFLYFELTAKGYPFIPDSQGEVARPFRDCEFAFIHPKKLNGVLTELIDYRLDELK